MLSFLTAFVLNYLRSELPDLPLTTRPFPAAKYYSVFKQSIKVH